MLAAQTPIDVAMSDDDADGDADAIELENSESSDDGGDADAEPVSAWICVPCPRSERRRPLTRRPCVQIHAPAASSVPSGKRKAAPEETAAALRQGTKKKTLEARKEKKKAAPAAEPDGAPVLQSFDGGKKKAKFRAAGEVETPTVTNHQEVVRRGAGVQKGALFKLASGTLVALVARWLVAGRRASALVSR